MERPATGVSGERESVRLSPCVCSTLRMVSRAVTQLYDDILRPSGLRVTQFSLLATIARSGEANLRQLEAALAIDQTTLTRSLSLLQRDRVIERVPHPDGRIKAVRLTRKGRRMLDVARPLWAQAQNKVLRELGTTAWHDAERRLAEEDAMATTDPFEPARRRKRRIGWYLVAVGAFLALRGIVEGSPITNLAT